MALGAGILGLQKLLGLSRNAMDELLSSDISNAHKFLTPNQFSLLSNEMAKVKQYQSNLPTQLSDIKKYEGEELSIAEEAQGLAHVWDPKKSFDADAAGSESDIFGINPRTGLPVYSKYGDAIDDGYWEDEAKEILMEHPGFGAVDALGQRISTKGTKYTSGTSAYRAEGQLDTPMSEDFLKTIQGGDQNLPDHLKALRHNILDTVLQKPPMTDTGIAKAGTAVEWIPGTNNIPGHWNPFEVTKEQSEAILENTHNLAARFNRLSIDDWVFMDQALNEAGLTSDLWKGYKKSEKQLKNSPWLWGPRPNIDKYGEAVPQTRGMAQDTSTDVKRFPDSGEERPLKNWKGEESLVLKYVLRAIDNAVATKEAGGLVDDPRDWYHMGQLQADYKEMWGEVVGTRLFLDFVNMIGASTAGAYPAKNFQAASYYDWLNFHKQLFTGQPIRMQGDGLPMGVGRTATYTFSEDFATPEIGEQWLSRKQYDLAKEHFDELDVAAKREKGDSWRKIWERDPVDARGEEGPQLSHKIWVGKDPGGKKYGGLMDKESLSALYAKGDAIGVDIRPPKGKNGQTFWNPNYGPAKGQKLARVPFSEGPGGEIETFGPGGLAGHMYESTHQGNMLTAMRKKYPEFKKNQGYPIAAGEFKQPDWIKRLINGASILADKDIGGRALKEISTLFRLDPMVATKGAHFAAALSGNLQAVTMDKVMTRTLMARSPSGRVIDAPADNTYAYLAEFIADIAKGYDMNPRDLQALIWLGTQDKSQVAGMGSSAIRTLDERIRITTAFLNKSLNKGDGGRFTVDQVRNLVLKKVIPALGVVPGINLGLDPEGELTDAEKEDL
jgi:hypothetical protein